MLWRTTWNEIRTRYAGSVLGLAWLIFFPILFLGCYCVYIFAMVDIKMGITAWHDAIERVLLIFCGLIPFFGFGDALSGGTISVTSNANLIKNTLFPIDLIPVKAVLVAQTTEVVGLGILMIALASQGRLTLWSLLLPLVWICQIMLSTGIIWILSSLNVYFRDLQNMISVIVLLLMLMSPIAYKSADIPHSIMPFMYVNPLYYLIVTYQQCLLFGARPDPFVTSVLVGMSLTFFFLGYWFFSRMKLVFSDNL